MFANTRNVTGTGRTSSDHAPHLRLQKGVLCFQTHIYTGTFRKKGEKVRSRKKKDLPLNGGVEKDLQAGDRPAKLESRYGAVEKRVFVNGKVRARPALPAGARRV